MLRGTHHALCSYSRALSYARGPDAVFHQPCGMDYGSASRLAPRHSNLSCLIAHLVGSSPIEFARSAEEQLRASFLSTPHAGAMKLHKSSLHLV